MTTLHYIIFETSEMNTVNFNQVKETSADTVRRTVEGVSPEQGVLKYEGSMPSSITALSTKQGPYTNREVRELLSSSDWTPPVNV